MLGYLLAPFIQVSTVLGTPLVGAKIYVYLSNSTTLATTYSDFQSHLNPNPVITDALGHATVIADDSTAYDVEIRDSYGVLLMSQKNLTVGGSGGGSGDIPVEAGYGIEVVRTEGAYKVSVDTDVVATHDDLVGKQDRLSAGDNIAIENNVVSVTGKKDLQVQSPINFVKTSSALRLYLDPDFVSTATAELTAGTCLKKEGGVISVDTDSTVSGTQNLVGGHNNTVDGLQNLVGGYNNTLTAYFDGDSTTDTEASFVMGDTNTVEGAYASAVIGVRNSLTNQETAFVFGSWNALMDGATNVVFGDENYADYDCQNNFVSGSNNELAEESRSNSLFGQSIRIGSNSENNFVGGDEIDIGEDCRFCFVHGNRHEIDDECRYNAVFGGRQTVGRTTSNDDATYAMLVSGMDNTVGSSGYGAVVGYGHTVNKATYSLVSGEDNEVTSVEAVAVLGMENSVTGNTASIVGGQSNNVADGSSSIIAGDYNVSTKAIACILAGTNNTISHSSDHQSSNCVVVGNTNDVFASQSVVAGRNNEVGNFSTNILNEGMLCVGLNSSVDGNWSAGIGEGINIAHDNMVAVGKYNVGNNSLFAVGCGTADNARADAFRVDGLGRCWANDPAGSGMFLLKPMHSRISSYIGASDTPIVFGGSALDNAGTMKDVISVTVDPYETIDIAISAMMQMERPSTSLTSGVTNGVISTWKVDSTDLHKETAYIRATAEDPVGVGNLHSRCVYTNDTGASVTLRAYLSNQFAVNQGTQIMISSTPTIPNGVTCSYIKIAGA